MQFNVDSFIPHKYKSDEHTYRKARLIVQTSFFTSIFSLFYLGVSLWLHMRYSALAMTLNVISYVTLPFLFRWGMSAFWTANLYILSGVIGVSICVAAHNILETSTIIWLALTPVISLLLSTKRNAFFWLSFNYLIIVGFGFVYHFGLISIKEIPPQYDTVFEVSSITGFMLLAFVVVLVFRQIAENSLRRVDEKNTKLEEALMSLQAAQAQLVHSEKMASLGELTAGIAHEIQNPLNFINNFSDVSSELIDEMNEALEKGNAAEAKDIAADIQHNLGKITHHGRRADAIVKGMLQHSRKSTSQKEPTDINALADEYLRLSYHGLRAKDKSFNATMQTAFDESIGKIPVIPQDMGRVLLNLFNNAFFAVQEQAKKSEGNYTPTVTVSTKKLAGKIEIKVLDNGTGISKNVQDKIFQPFFTTKPTGQGTGLGLSMAYDIITKEHGGSIQVHSSEGAGTDFTIALPV